MYHTNDVMLCSIFLCVYISTLFSVPSENKKKKKQSFTSAVAEDSTRSNPENLPVIVFSAAHLFTRSKEETTYN